MSTSRQLRSAATVRQFSTPTPLVEASHQAFNDTRGKRL